MDWMDQVLEKAKRKNQILFPKDSPLLHGLAQLLPRQDRRVLILWALDLAEETVQALENRHPDEPRPRNALTAARLWAAGDVKMPSARREILRCHALAKELPDPAELGEPPREGLLEYWKEGDPIPRGMDRYVEEWRGRQRAEERRRAKEAGQAGESGELR